MKIFRSQTRAEQAQKLAEQVAQELRAALAARGKATLCVPGGSTPEAFLQALAGQELDWSNIIVLPNDERQVPEDHTRSNARMIRAALLQGKAAQAQYLSLYVPEGTQGLSQRLRALMPLDVLVLGMGADMHTASLFPGADRLAEALDPACPDLVLPMRAEGAGEPRLSLSLPVLLGAGTAHLLINGTEKQAALQAALEESDDLKAPVGAVLRRRAVTIHDAP